MRELVILKDSQDLRKSIASGVFLAKEKKCGSIRFDSEMPVNLQVLSRWGIGT